MVQGNSSSAITVLIADDHDWARRSYRDILESESGLRVVAEACSGREAVEKAAVCGPGVVLMDISMPEMNGMEATRVLQQRYPEIEVLILTVHCSVELVKEAFHAGARGYLLKTDADTELIPAVRSVGQHQTYVARQLRRPMGIADASPDATEH